jgi:hypothetical protein
VVAVAVAEDSLRADAMDALTNVSGIGGGPGAVTEPDIYYQGVGAISRKVTAAGFYTTTGANRNLTATGRKTWMVKVAVTNYAALNATGLDVRVGSGTGAYYAYRVASSAAAELYPPRGGFLIIPIDPNVAAHRTSTTGSPNLAACSYFGCVGNLSAASKAENLVLDAVDIGVGLYLTGGTSTDPDGAFPDFTTDDEGTVAAGRFGYVTTQNGILFVRGRLIIGATSASGTLTATATVFTDSNRVLVFPDHLADVGFSGITVDLGNASNVVTWTGIQFLGAGRTSPDTRPVLEVFGTTATSQSVWTRCTFAGFRSMLLTSKVTLQDCVVRSTETITHAGATIDGCSFSSHPTAAGSSMITTANPSTITDCTFDNTGGTGHAIVITAAGTYTFDGNLFAGYGADGTTSAAIYNNSGGLVTLNITGGGSTPTVRNGAGASTTINSNVSVTLTGLKNPSEVRVFNAGTTTERSGTGAENVTSGSHTFSLPSGTSVDIVILSLAYQNLRLLSFSTTADTTVPVQQQLDRQYLNP